MLSTLLLCLSICAASDANLIHNGNLEAADPSQADRPAGFAPGQVGKHEATMTWASPGYKSKRCVAVQTADSSGLGYWQTTVAVKPQTDYTVSFYYKTQAATPSAHSKADPLYNQGRPGGPNLELGAPDDTTEPTTWTDIGAAIDPVGGLFLPVASDWSRYEHVFTTRPDQTQLIIKLRLWCYAQKVWFDDVSLVAGARKISTPARDSLWAPADTTPPRVFRPFPPPNSQADADTVISAKFANLGSRIEIGSINITLDGKDVTADATITADGAALKPGNLAAGAHRVIVHLTDKAGNAGNRLSWQFGVGETLRNKLVADTKTTQLNGEDFFPLCIYAYSVHPDDGRFRADHLQQAADAGYNIVLNTIEKRKGLDKELAAGIMGTLNITGGLPFCTDAAAAEKAFFEPVQGKIASHQQGQFADHPAVVAFWGDDPENVENTQATPMTQSAKDKLKHARDAMKNRYPDIPSVYAISNLPRLEDGMKYGDILLSYRYAVSKYHPMMINGYTIAICRQMVPDKPLWFLSQAVDIGYGAKVHLPKPMRPTPAETRAMAWYSLVCGVRGYAIYANYINAHDYPEHWQVTLDIATQMRQLAPALAAGKDVSTARLQKHPNDASIFFRELKHDGVHTLIAVNMSAGTIPATWRFRQPVKLQALFEDRAMSKAANKVVDVFQPWGVHLYQWQ